jgi:hypothetical protein
MVMASSDARIFPLKGVAYRVTFPIYDVNGDLVSGAASLDSEVSKDSGAFTDCTNEAVEIATSSGMYYLDLTSTEMNADTVAILVKTSTSDAKTTALVFYTDPSIARGTVDNTSFTPTATQFEASDIVNSSDDHYNGRVLVMVSGSLIKQAVLITDYTLTGGRGHFTVSGFTTAPSNGDLFLIY